MKKFLTLVLLATSSLVYSQTPTLRWVSGSTDFNEKSSLNFTEPNPRQGSQSFTDSNGDFWLFGGEGQDGGLTTGIYNDVWKYEQSSSSWTWIDGQYTVDRSVPEYNNSLAFDGIDDLAEIEVDPINFLEDFTIELWFKTESDGDLFSYSPQDEEEEANGFGIRLTNSGATIWVIKNNTIELEINLPTSIANDEWHHLAMTYTQGDGLFESETISVYLDGDFWDQVQINWGNNFNLNDDHTFLIAARRSNGGTDYFNGQIDELRFWSIERNAGEIKSDYRIELPNNTEFLEGYYDFNQGIADSNSNYETEILNKIDNEVHASLGDIYRPGTLSGELAEVRVWSTFYNSFDEITAIANSTVDGTETDLLSAYDFSGGIPDGDNTLLSSISDLTSTGNDGDLLAFELNGATSNFSSGQPAIISNSYEKSFGSGGALIGDFNSDTYDDIVARSSDAISLSLNDQTGALATFTNFQADAFVQDITLGDWNGDTNLDVAAVSWDDDTNTVRIFFGDGAGDFPSSLGIDTGDDTRPFKVETGDMNDDTFDDLVVSTSNQEIFIYAGDGTGNFGAPIVLDVENLIGYPIVDDFTNDGVLDIGFSYFTNQSLFGVYVNDGNGSFALTSSSQSILMNGIKTYDVNVDGNKDILYVNGFNTGVALGNGDGTFGQTLNNEGFADFNLSDLTIVGINDYGNLEVLISTYNTKILQIEVLTDGTFVYGREVNVSSSPGEGEFGIADLNKDGINDIIIPTNSNIIDVFLREQNSFDRITDFQTIDFDGFDDQIEIPNLRPYDNSFTVEAWIKTEDNGPIFSFMPQGDTYDYELNGTGGFTLSIVDGYTRLYIEGIGEFEGNNQTVLADGNWHHIALAVQIEEFSNDQIEIWVDGDIKMSQYTDWDGNIDVANLDYVTKLGYATADFKDVIGLGGTSQTPESNWTLGFPFQDESNGRAYAASWVDNDLLYVFGGQGLHGYYNSIRQFDPNTRRWTTIKGSEDPDYPGDYGIQGIADEFNQPPSRFLVKGATDTDGNQWFFGGRYNGDSNFLNDLWKYDPLLNEWTWVSGTDQMNALPVFESLNVPSATAMPGGRENNNIWFDTNGDLWLFGGFGLDESGEEGHLNDLWKFDLTTNEWTWMAGSSLANQGGSYGELGEYSATNYPGGRTAAQSWQTSDGNVWLFGGQGYDKFGVSFEYLNDLWSYNASTGQWAWFAGSDFANSTGSYNEKGLSSTDYIPGARQHGIGWVDNYENLWLFGGNFPNQVTTGTYNDFWKYELASQEWTWVSGFNSTADNKELGVYGDLGEPDVPYPGARHGALTWTEEDGTFWLYGGAFVGSSSFGMLTDLWKYQIETDRWTYLGGSTSPVLNEGVYGSKGIGSDTNEPKSRWHGSSWLGDDGKLWFFGGLNQDTFTDVVAWLNDLWFYDPESKTYTWMAGESVIDGEAVYGTRGEASVGHIPGARSSSAFWKDFEGNFWLFGGYESFEYNNDLWKFNPNTLEWTWVSGNNFQNTPGSYGEFRVEDEGNLIGARRYMDARQDSEGNIWIFGGQGYDGLGQFGNLSDMWRYNPTTNRWTWMSGPAEFNTAGVYGTLGVPDAANVPPPRYAYSSWMDDSDNIWITGGVGLQDDGAGNLVNIVFNDIWKFDTRSLEWTWMGGSNDIFSDGNYGDQGQFDEENIFTGRQRSQVFETFDKSLYLYGGRINSSTNFNDLWEIKFTPGIAEIFTPSAVSQTTFQFGFNEPWTRDYQIQVDLLDDFSNPFFDQGQTESSITIGGLSPGTNYYYRVNAINEIGESGFSPTQSVLTLPATPTFESLELAVTDISSTAATINWEVTSGILDGYFMDISTDPTFEDPAQVHLDFSNKSIAVSQIESVSDLTPGTGYYVRLRSFNTSGFSEYSQVVPFLTQPATVNYPENAVTEIEQTSATINWIPVPEILSNYQLTISTLNDGFADASAFLADYTDLDLSKDRNSVPVDGLSPGTFYYGVVSAVNASGESEQPEAITILTTPNSPVFSLDASVSAVTQSDVTFEWQAPEGAFDGYLLEVSTDFTFANTNLMLEEYGRGGTPKNLESTQLEETVSGLMPGQTYFVRIRSYNSSGQSPNSNIISFTTIPRAPASGNIGNISQTSASLSWQPATGADTYLLDLNTADDFAEETQVFSDFPLAVAFEVLSDLTPGTRYYIRVQSSNSSGTSGSADDYYSGSFITIPSTPVLNDADNFTQSSLRISWNDVEGADDYVVDASDNFFQTFLIGYTQTATSETEIEVVGLTPGEEYQVRVRSRNSSGTSPNIGVFDLEPVPATPVARDASSVSASVFTANWDGSAGADYYVLEVSLDEFQTFHYNEIINSSNPVQLVNLVAGAQYKYRVRAGNAFGESPNSNEVIVLAQNDASALSMDVTFDEDFLENATSSTVSVSLDGVTSVTTVSWRYRGILSSEWSELTEIAVASNTFQFEISSFMLDDIGVEFEVYANDGVTFLQSLGNKITRSFTESQSEEFPSLVFKDWQMIAIPYVLDQPEVVNVFNELSGLEYKKKWRIMHYDNGAYQDGITGFNNIELGKGYWFNVLNEVTISIGAGSANADIPYNIVLDQGWNQIGNPFNAEVSWGEVLLAGGHSAIVDNLFVYNTESKEFNSNVRLQPFEGAFVWAEESVNVEVFPTSFSGRAEEFVEIASADGRNWNLPLQLNMGGRNRVVAGVGMNTQANELKDSFDQLVPPRFVNYTEMFTTREDYLYPYFSKDIVPVKDNHIWEYKLESNVGSGPGSLQWDNVPMLNNSVHLWLVDETTGRVVNMAEADSYQFNFAGTHQFSIHYSTDPNYQVLPSILSMGDAFPNPANTFTTIPILLPQQAESYDLELSVIDLQGRKVKVLAKDRFYSGLHEFRWSIDDQLEDGIYIYQLTFADPAIKPIQKKLLIKK